MRRLVIFILSFIIVTGTVFAATVNLNKLGEDAKSQCFYYKNYSKANVAFQYDLANTNTLKGTISATGLKPNITYQLKIWGKPTCLFGTAGNDLANEYIGYNGRWTCANCNGTAVQRNRDDAGYRACNRSKGCKECIQGYLVFDFFTADKSGAVTKSVESDSSYHVLWCNGGVCGLSSSTFLNGHVCPADKVEGQIERGSCGTLKLFNGTYNVVMGITEESFHENSCWATVLVNDNLNFSISGKVLNSSNVTPKKDFDSNGSVDFVDFGNPQSESDHNALDWGSINSGGGYGGKDLTDSLDDEGAGNPKDMRVVWGGFPNLKCNESNRWASFTLDTNSFEGTILKLRALDGSSNDSFKIFLVKNNQEILVGSHLADYFPGKTTEYWKTINFNLQNIDGSPFSGLITFKIYSTGQKGDYCESGFYGQNAFSWAMIYGKPQQQIPEFGPIAALVAIIGAVTVFVILRKH